MIIKNALFTIVFSTVLGASCSATAQTILFLGDSLTEGYGISQSEAYPEVVKRLAKTKLKKDIKVINAGVSGSTTASGLERLKWSLKKETPTLLVLALGANDGLRGFDLQKTKKSLSDIIDFAQSKKIKVMLAEMLMPPNYGPDYTKKFNQLFKDLAKEKSIKLIPFFLNGVAGQKDLNLPDGIHPNVKGHEKIGETVFTYIKGEI